MDHQFIPYGIMNFLPTQFLSEHRKYLNEFGDDSTASSPIWLDYEEKAGHVTFHCPRYASGLDNALTL